MLAGYRGIIQQCRVSPSNATSITPAQRFPSIGMTVMVLR